MKLEWDTTKAKLNIKKHGISFQEAATVFNDNLSFTYDDEVHSRTERRYATLDMSNVGHVLVVAHTMRGELTKNNTSHEESEESSSGRWQA